MEYRKLGRTGLDVSPICMGCMSIGEPGNSFTTWSIIDEVGRIAPSRGVPRAQVTLAWLMQKPGITAPIVGISKERHLNDAIAALDLNLDADEIAALEQQYPPHPIVGFS